MRAGCALLGSCLVPLGFCLVWLQTESLAAAATAATLLLCDTGLTTLSRYILLDPALLVFILGSVVAHTVFRRQPVWSAGWWGWLAATGLLLGAAVSTKLVGLLVVSLVS